jgi:hypothetical protein
MVKKEVSFMKKKGAPKSMVKHEMAEAGMKKGGKVKKMAMGGTGGIMMGGAGIRKVSNAAPPKGPAAMQAMQKQKQFMSDKLRGSPLAPGVSPRGATTGGGRPGPRTPRDIGDGRPPAMGPKPGLGPRGSPFAPGLGPRGATVGGGRPAPVPKPVRDIGTGSMPRPSLGGATPKPRGVGMGVAAKKIAGVGAGAARALMGKKAGGLAAGHKEADGIAKKGKTKAMQVKMAGGGKTKKYC